MKMLSEKSEKLREELATQVAKDLGLKNCKVTLSIEVENIEEDKEQEQEQDDREDWEKDYDDLLYKEIRDIEKLIDATSLDLTKARKRRDYKRAAEIDEELDDLFDKLEWIKTL